MCVVVLCICVVVFGYTCVLFCLLAFILQYNTKSSLANSLSLAIKGQKEGLVVSFICCYCFIGILKYNKMVIGFCWWNVFYMVMERIDLLSIGCWRLTSHVWNIAFLSPYFDWSSKSVFVPSSPFVSQKHTYRTKRKSSLKQDFFPKEKKT